MISKILFIIPIPIFYTNRFMKEWVGGVSLGLFILIRPKYKYDEGIHAHELEHCRQFYGLAFVYILFYWLLSKQGIFDFSLIYASVGFSLHGLFRVFDRYRYWSELQAYQCQLRLSEASKCARRLKWYATAISTRYKLGKKYNYDRVVSELRK